MAEKAVKKLQKGIDSPGEVELKGVMSYLIQHFKTNMKIPFEPVKKANWMAVLKAITDKDGHCIWNQLEEPDNNTDDDKMEIQEADALKFVNWMEFEEDSEEEQTKWIIQLFKTH